MRAAPAATRSVPTVSATLNSSLCGGRHSTLLHIRCSGRARTFQHRNSRALQHLFLRPTQALVNQMTQTAACDRHRCGLAKWRPGSASLTRGCTHPSLSERSETGSFDHFFTPLGVFAHSLANPDLRAEGSLNESHIGGHGVRGRRVFDFGWAIAAHAWGAYRAPGRTGCLCGVAQTKSFRVTTTRHGRRPVRTPAPSKNRLQGKLHEPEHSPSSRSGSASLARRDQP